MPSSFVTSTRTGGWLSGTSTGALLEVLVGHPEVPGEDEGLALGVTDHPLTVSPELWVVGWQEQEPGQGPLPERLDHVAIAELADRSEERRVGKECRSRWSTYH